MRHDHVGPLDKACPGCFIELWEDEQEEKRQVFWRRMLVIFLIVLAIGSMAALSFAINKYGTHIG